MSNYHTPVLLEEAIELLRDYFMNKRQARSREIFEKRQEADSARLAQGDSTRVEYPVADEAMFESEQEREELSEQIRALQELKKMALSYGYDISMPAKNTKEAIQWLYFGYLAAVKEQNGAAMSLGRTSTFIDIYIERDLKKGIFTESLALARLQRDSACVCSAFWKRQIYSAEYARITANGLKIILLLNSEMVRNIFQTIPLHQA